jgi:hypothetical protein
MKNTDFSNLDILAHSMSIWDKICYDKGKTGMKTVLITKLIKIMEHPDPASKQSA